MPLLAVQVEQLCEPALSVATLGGLACRLDGEAELEQVPGEIGTPIHRDPEPLHGAPCVDDRAAVLPVSAHGAGTELTLADRTTQAALLGGDTGGHGSSVRRERTILIGSHAERPCGELRIA